MVPGVVYLSTIPPYMGKKKLQRLFSEVAEVDRIHLTPEPRQNRRLRREHGGNTRRSYIEGWVEFKDKKDAKRVALMYCGAEIGGKKRHNFYRDDRWNIRYLPKFTWEHLQQKIESDKRQAGQHIVEEVALVRKANRFWSDQVNKARGLDAIQTRKKKKFEAVRSFPQTDPVLEE
jgi:ESF2/ABP1 family protein